MNKQEIIKNKEFDLIIDQLKTKNLKLSEKDRIKIYEYLISYRELMNDINGIYYNHIFEEE